MRNIFNGIMMIYILLERSWCVDVKNGIIIQALQFVMRKLPNCT